jgi:hypothetical protein
MINVRGRAFVSRHSQKTKTTFGRKFSIARTGIGDNHEAALEQFREITPGLAPKEKNLNT